MRGPLSNLLYRRILLWAVAALTVYLLFFAGSRKTPTPITTNGERAKPASHVVAQVAQMRPVGGDAQIAHEQDSALKNVVAQKPPPKHDAKKPHAAKVDAEVQDAKLRDTKSSNKQLKDTQAKSPKGQGAKAKAGNGNQPAGPQAFQGPQGAGVPGKGIGNKNSAKEVAEEAVERLLQQKAKYEKLKKERMGTGRKDKPSANDVDLEGLEEDEVVPEPKEGPADAPIPAEQINGLPSEPKADTDKDGSEYRPQYSDDEELYDERVDDDDLDRLIGIKPELIALAVQNFKDMPWLQFPQYVQFHLLWTQT